MKIEILGMGCPKCQALEKNAREAAEMLALDAQFEKISDMDKILDYGVMVTPALAVNGEVKSSGKLLSTSEISEILSQI